MKTVKTFTNLSEAGFASSLLEAVGIPASITGEQSFLYVAGIMTQGVHVQVEDQDFDWAVRVLQEGLDAPPPPASSEPMGEKGKMPVGIFIAVAAAYALLGFAIYQSREEARTWMRRVESKIEKYDDNGDGRPDHFYTYQRGTVVHGEVDRNFDGKIDEWDTYDQAGRIAQVEEDDNFDGRPDIWYFYKNGLVVRSEQDVDYNGKADWFTTYENGLPVRSDCRPNGSKVVVRRLIYVHGILTEEWVDEDQDGKFDYKILHDPFGATSARIPIGPAK